MMKMLAIAPLLMLGGAAEVLPESALLGRRILQSGGLSQCAADINLVSTHRAE
jgi:hypothetical protein